jgi:hypothetical protein
MLAVAPRNCLDHHGLAPAAIGAPHRVQQKDQKAPERDEFVTPFRELIVTGRWLMPDCARIQLSLGEQIHLIGADLFRSKLIRRTMKMLGEGLYDLLPTRSVRRAGGFVQTA